MRTESPTGPPLDFSDIQGLILRGYNLPHTRYLILRIDDAGGAQALCKALLPGSSAPLTVTTAAPWPVKPACCLSLGVTSSGLAKLIGPANYSLVNRGTSGALFGPFAAGAAARAGQVGDTGPSRPQNWWQNGNWKLPQPPSNDGLDLLISLYTQTPEDRDSFTTTLLGMIPAGANGQPSVVPAFIQDADDLVDAAGKPTRIIHFGYVDSLSQPRIQGTPWDDPGDPTDDRPLVPAWHFRIVASAPNYRAHPLLVNGSFGAFRLLYQDVGAFEAFIGKGANPGLVAAKMCGRWLDGTPLVVSPDAPDPSLTGTALNNFNYLKPSAHQQGPRQPDDLGLQCPYAAHIRRTNPRDDVNVLGNNFPNYPDAALHRVMRRAGPYGPPYSPETADAQRGLVGLFLGANLTDQFEFVVQSWMNQGGFRSPDGSPNGSGVDPLFGPQPDPPPPAGYSDLDYLTTPPATYETVSGLQRFVRTDGGLYVFLPGIAGLRSLSQGTLAAPASAAA